jgi:predicted ATP-dependent serine protease
MKTKIDNLKTIKNFALLNKVTASYIYKLIKEGKMKPVIIDNVQFIDMSVYKALPNK